MSRSAPASPGSLAYETVEILRKEPGFVTSKALEVATGRFVNLRTFEAHPASASWAAALGSLVEGLADSCPAGLVPPARVTVRRNRLTVVRAHVEGTTVRERLAVGPMSVPEAVEVARQILSTVAWIHAAGHLHGRLHPGNVVLANDGADPPSSLATRIVDFLPLPEPCGTIPLGRDARYSAPEQSPLLGRVADERADLYLCGLLLVEVLTGRFPFSGGTDTDILRQHVSSPVPTLRSAGVAVPTALDDMLQRLLVKDPDDRYSSALAVLTDVEELAAELRSGASQPLVVVGRHDRRRTIAEPAFTGRLPELVQLERRLHEAKIGAGTLITLEGGSGAGKSRLLNELCERAAAAGFVVYRGHALDRVAPRPLRMLTGLVDEVVAEATREPDLASTLRRRVGAAAAVVAEVVPDLATSLDLRPTGTAHLGPEPVRHARLRQSMVEFIDGLGAASRPALIALDDCQWMDELSATILAEWVRHGRWAPDGGSHVVIVAAARSEDLSTFHPLRAISEADRCILAPLPPPAVVQMVESMAGPVPGELLTTVLRLSQGNPFMVSAVLHGLLETGALRAGESGWQLEISGGELQASRESAAMLTRRMEMLPTTARRLLEIAAVLGRTFDLEFVCALSGFTLAKGRAAMAIAVERHLVWTDQDRFRFVHDLVRESFLHCVDGGTIADIHRRAAESIEASAPDRDYELAYHFGAAGLAARAYPYAIRSAEQARLLNDLQLAEQQYLIAERGVADACPGDRMAVIEALAEVQMLRGSYAQARERLQSALRLSPDDLTTARLYKQLGELDFKLDDMPAAARQLEFALSILGERIRSRTWVLAILLVKELVLGFLTGRGRRLGGARDTEEIRSRRPRTRWSNRLARKRLDDIPERRQLLAQVHTRLLYAWWFNRSAVSTLWALVRQVNVAERAGSKRELAHAYAVYGAALAAAAPLLWRRGLRYCETATNLHGDASDLWGYGQALSMKAICFYAGCRYEQACDVGAAAVAALQRSGDPWELNYAGWHLALFRYRLGDLEGAVAQAHIVYGAAVSLGDAQAEALSVEIWARAADGDIPTDVIDAALARPSGDVENRVALLQAKALHLRSRGDLPAARLAAEEAIRHIRRGRTMSIYLAPAFASAASVHRSLAEDAGLVAAPQRKWALRRAWISAGLACAVALLYRHDRSRSLREAALVAALRGRSNRSKRLFQRSERMARAQHEEAELGETLRARRRIWRTLGWAETDGATERTDGGSDPPLAAPGPASGALTSDERFAALHDAGRWLVSAEDQESLAAAVRDAVAVLLRPERCDVLGIGLSSGEAPAEESPEMDLVRAATEKGAPVSASLPVAAPRAGVSQSDFSRLRSVLCAPLTIDSAVCGWLLLSSSAPSAHFGPNEERLAEFITQLASAALKRIHLRQDVGSRVSQAQEAERARIARDLHDEIGQALTSVLLGLHLVATALEKPDPDRAWLLQRTDEVRNAAVTALEQVQRLAFEMRPTVLDDLGLTAALRRLVAEFALRSDGSIHLTADISAGDRLTQEIETTVYRVAQEALTNVARHAKASTGSVLLARAEDRIRLVVEDDGAGFEPLEQVSSLGLRGMSERAALVDGSLRIVSSPGSGTTVVLEVPVGSYP